FKAAVAEAVVEELRPVREKFNELMKDKAYLTECIDKGTQSALRISQRTLDKVNKKIGLIRL
ncbi:MAG TPA: tryptophan--tRNA ligase, partial [Clostridiales bacterium]|nr:tryptophan--tRNA ligase [Clostridiales bacterium]